MRQMSLQHLFRTAEGHFGYFSLQKLKNHAWFGTSRMLKNAEQATVGALYERAFFLESNRMRAVIDPAPTEERPNRDQNL